VNGADTEVGDLVPKVESGVIRMGNRSSTRSSVYREGVAPLGRAARDTCGRRCPADFTVGVYPRPRKEVARVMNSTGVRFIRAGEPEARYAHGDGCYQIVQDPWSGDDEWTRYGSMLCSGAGGRNRTGRPR
jgi:hypothetical protein